MLLSSLVGLGVLHCRELFGQLLNLGLIVVVPLPGDFELLLVLLESLLFEAKLPLYVGVPLIEVVHLSTDGPTLTFEDSTTLK